MCCEICPKYDECEEKDRLKEQCCLQCSEYDYCMGENKHGDIDEYNNEEDNKNYDIGEMTE